MFNSGIRPFDLVQMSGWVVLVAALSSSCSMSDEQSCDGDSDCATGQQCVESGGLLFGSSVCVALTATDPDATGARDTAEPADAPLPDAVIPPADTVQPDDSLDGRDGDATADVADTDPSDATPDTADGESRSGIVDHFGDGNIAEYVGQTSMYGVTDDTPISGSYSLQIFDAGAYNWDDGGYDTIVSMQGLWRYPRVGDIFSIDIRVDDPDTDGAVLWGVQNGSHPWPGYRLRIDTGNSPGIELEKISVDGPIESDVIDQEAPENVLSDRKTGGFAPEFAGDDYDIHPQPGITYTCTIHWQANGQMPYVCRDPQGNELGRDDDPKADTEYTDGGVGFMSTQSGPHVDGRGATFDLYLIK